MRINARALALLISVTMGFSEISSARAGAPPESATSLTQMHLDREGDAFTAVLVANGTMQQRVFQQNDGRQLIVEIPNVLNPLRHYYPASPDPLVERILMYEYPPSGDRSGPVSRVVFELKSPAEHRIGALASELRITLTPKAHGAPARDAKDSDVIPPWTEREPDIPPVEELASDPPEAPAPPAEPPPNPFVPARIEIQPEGVAPTLFFGPDASSVEDYHVGAEDVIEVRVFELDELNRTVRVSGNGRIDLPLVGTLAVGGLTSDEVSAAVAAELEDRFVQNPQVSVFVKEFNSRRVSLLGSVRSPSTYPLLGKKNLLQLLADAGGLSDRAGSLLYVFRQTADGRSARLTVPLTELMVHGDPRWNVWLRPGDVVSVPPEAALSVSILGAVRQPGIHKLPVGDGATLLKAIALAGGLSDRASKRGIQIKRLDRRTGEETLIKVNLGDVLGGKEPDVVLLEGDVVVVKESFF